MRGFNKFLKLIEADAPMGDDYWAKRLSQFQAAAAGQKGAISDQRPTSSPTPTTRPTSQPTMQNFSRALRPEEVKSLGLHPNHKLVWRGSTADAPNVYPYVYVQRLNKYLTNPNYRR